MYLFLNNSSEKGVGPTIVYPPHEKVSKCMKNLMKNQVKQIFNATGTAVEVPTLENMRALMTATCMMAPYYGVLGQMISWTVDKVSYNSFYNYFNRVLIPLLPGSISLPSFPLFTWILMKQQKKETASRNLFKIAKRQEASMNNLYARFLFFLH
jgi:hypothetical protein